MCFIVTDEQVKTAEEDFCVFKIGESFGDHFIPAYKRNFHYMKDQLTDKVELVVEQREFANGKEYLAIEQGYHCYSSPQCDAAIGIRRMLFDMMRFRGLMPSFGVFVLRKGTNYHLNKYGEIVAERLIYKRKLI